MEHHDAKARDAKARFVNYCNNRQRILQEDELKQRLKAGQKEKIEVAVQKTLLLLHSPSSVFCTEEDFSTMQESLEAALAEIMTVGCEAADAGGVREAAMPEAPSHEAVSRGGLPRVPEAETLYSEGGV